MHEMFETVRGPNIQITGIDEAETFNKIMEKNSPTLRKYILLQKK